MKDRAKQERAKGNKAIVVNIPANPLSRGSSGMGYLVYHIESEANKQAREKKQTIMRIRSLAVELASAKDSVDELQAKYDAELSTINWDWRHEIG